MEAYQVMFLLVVIGIIVAVVWEILELRDELEIATEEAVYSKLRLQEEKEKLMRLEHKYKEFREDARHYKNRVEYDTKDVPELRKLRHNVEKMKEFDKLETILVVGKDEIDSFKITRDGVMVDYTLTVDKSIDGTVKFGLVLERGEKLICYKKDYVFRPDGKHTYSGEATVVRKLEDLLDD